MTWVYIAVGGFLGSIVRFFIANRLKNVNFPYATVIVNLSGSFLLGVVVGSAIDSRIALFLGVGFLGSYTTFSTFMIETIHLAINRSWKKVVTYTLVSFTLGIMLAFAGFFIGTLLTKT